MQNDIFIVLALPAALQRKVVYLGKSLGQEGKPREKYWFPPISSMIYSAIDQCYECQLATKQNREEPVKVTDIPSPP